MGIAGLFKPEYLLRPGQLARRAYATLFGARADRLTARLPWGWPIEVDPNELLGKALLNLGVYDLAVTEVIWRLCDKGETALDVGANIGVMTALLAYRVAGSGKVLCFEADPEIQKDLGTNVSLWRPLVGESVIDVIPHALSDKEGFVSFAAVPKQSPNRGLGRVVDGETVRAAGEAVVSVPCSTLDACLDGISAVGLAKVDVEGHEEAVLRGGREVLKELRVRDWVFEHHSAYPSGVTKLLERAGYKLFWIEKRFFRPVLIDTSAPTVRSAWEAQSILATLDVSRALGRLKSAGWQCMK